jgi:hypothetical protein
VVITAFSFVRWAVASLVPRSTSGRILSLGVCLDKISCMDFVSK